MREAEKQARGKRAASILQRNSMPFLLQLADNPGWHAPTAVAAMIRCDAKYAVNIAKRLRAAELTELRGVGQVAGKMVYETRLTDRGQELVHMLRPVVEFLEDENPKDHGRSRRKTSHN